MSSSSCSCSSSCQAYGTLIICFLYLFPYIYGVKFFKMCIYKLPMLPTSSSMHYEFSTTKLLPLHASVTFSYSPAHDTCSSAQFICKCTEHTEGRDSSVSTATRYGLDGLGIESWWGARFAAPIQAGPGAHPTTYTVGTKPFPRG